MERNRCPGCGLPYNGRKCRNCLFQPAKTDLSSGRTGERQRKGSGKPSEGRKKEKSALRSLLGFLVILLLIALLLPSLRNWGTELKAMGHANSIVQITSD